MGHPCRRGACVFLRYYGALMIKAYSYIRFSTPEQSKGDSKRRQTDMVKHWLAAHPKYTLDTELTLHDLGVSAYRGKNLDTTAKLGGFLEAVKQGDVAQGSVLLLESLDRLTRQSARKAVSTLGDIVDLGIDVCTLNDGKHYSKESFDDIELVIAVLLMSRAHNESKEKGRRVAAAWDAKRKLGKLMTRAVPGWIARDGKGQLLPDRAKIVKRIFSMYVKGTGKHGIAQALNADKVPTWGVGKRKAGYWHQSYIQKILHSETVIGRMTPHTDDGTTRTPQAPIENYYPAAIDRELWDTAQSMLTAGRSRAVVAGRVQNILGGLAKCPLCGGSMTRIAKGSRSKPKLVCASAKAGGRTGCKYVSVALDEITAALVHTASQKWPAKIRGLDDALRDADAGLETTLERIDATVRSLEKAPTSKTLLAKLAELEAGADRARAVLAGLQAQASQTETQLLKRREARYRAALTAKPLDVAAANAVLKECVSKVVVDHTQGVLRMFWKHDGETDIDYHFPPVSAAKKKG
jgi:DNA invertase Pin-like site-specific DNA recombinase